jgi:hypothetical protein
MDPLLDTVAAADWLDRHGVRRSPATLRKLRCLGGGPRYRKLNSRPYYTEPDLIAWVEERLSVPVGSTSEPNPALPGTTGRERYKPATRARAAAEPS